MDRFYDPNPDTASFATAVIDQNGLNAVHWNCSGFVNCTSEELANLQWGSSDVTYRPRFFGPDASNYFPKSYTINKWGIYKVPGVTVALEFKYYQSFNKQQDLSLNVTQVGLLMSDSFYDRGMTNLYTAASFANNVECFNYQQLKEW